MPSVLATIVAVATAAVLLRVSIARLNAGEMLMVRGRTDAIRSVAGELEELRCTLRDACDRPTTGDGT